MEMLPTGHVIIWSCDLKSKQLKFWKFWLNRTSLVNPPYLDQKWLFSHDTRCYLKAKRKEFPVHIFSYLLEFYFESYKPSNTNVSIIKPVLLTTVC